MTGISSAITSTHSSKGLIRKLKNPTPAAPFASLGTEKLDVLKKLAEIFQGQISSKNTLESTETQIKVLEQG